jgi:7,8-dihydropterin-6-yl-methyl-4-(beta-D-ribofuranosyl)aminobenzene 5'-phosphate synthase
MRKSFFLSLLCFVLAIPFCVPQAEAQAPARPAHAQVKTLKVTILSTMLADRGIGEWGFAALVESDGHRILVDTGTRPETVLTNARELDVDLSDVKEVILTHNHDDHVGGLLRLRRELMKKNPSALSVVHVGKGIFYSRATQWLPYGKITRAPAVRLSSTTKRRKFFRVHGSQDRCRAPILSTTGR